MTERLEDLKARSKEVLMKAKPELREKLIRFARTSRDPKTGKPSPTKAEKRALQSTGDADKALACWQLTVILRDFNEEEFEKHISDICQNKEKQKQEEKKMEEKKTTKELLLPERTTIVLDDPDAGGHRVSFVNEPLTISFCADLLGKIFYSEKPPTKGGGYDWTYLKNYLIQILGERFGLEPFIEVLEKSGVDVKICWNCGYYCENPTIGAKVGRGVCKRLYHHKQDEFRGQMLYGTWDIEAYAIDKQDMICKRWTPKKVSEK